MKVGHNPDLMKVVFRDLPSVTGLVTRGELIIPYSSSIILVETPKEILADKIRALYERPYIKGRDIYDIWWLSKQMKVKVAWDQIRVKFNMYQADFYPAREHDYFQNKENIEDIRNALRADLSRFIPQQIYSIYKENNFIEFIDSLKNVTLALLKQGMRKYLRDYERRKINS